MKLIEDAKTAGFNCLEWNGSHHKAKWLCPSGHQFEKRASLLKHSDYSCPECWKIRNKTKKGFKNQSGGASIQLTSDPIKDFEKEGYKVVGTYINNRTKVELICPRGHNCQIRRGAFIQGTRCRDCKFENQSRKNRESMYDRILKLSADQNLTLITPIDEYENSKTRLQFVRDNGSIFDTCAVNIMANDGLIDGDINKRITALTIDEINKRLGESLVIVGGKYVNNDSVMNFRCVDKGHLFKDTIKGFKYTCPHCQIPTTEQRWVDFLKDRNTDYILHHKVAGSEIDLYIPEYSLGLEICGLAFHSENDRFRGNRLNPRRHIEKRIKCESHNIRLFTIYENENKSPIWESMIENAMGRSIRVYARKCLIKMVDSKEAKQFLDINHMMGYSSAKHLGLYHEGKLITIFGYKTTSGVTEITRFASSLGHTVVGGFSKLLQKVIEDTKTKHVLSFVDLRYGNGSSLLKSGFVKTGETLGWKWTDFRTTYNRLQCRANMDERRLSEKEYAEELGWYKIYDCGQAKYELFL
jgi:hypothetical protein